MDFHLLQLLRADERAFFSFSPSLRGVRSTTKQSSKNVITLSGLLRTLRVLAMTAEREGVLAMTASRGRVILN